MHQEARTRARSSDQRMRRRPRTSPACGSKLAKVATHGFIGDLLVRKGIVDAAQLARAAAAQSAKRITLGRAIADLGLAEESEVASIIASALHLEYLDGDPPPIGPAVLALLPETLCRTHRAVPLSVSGNQLRLAVADPLNYPVFQDVE
jgi:type IV pilus assembly protein PilB